jgi:hypothetical protein
VAFTAANGTWSSVYNSVNNATSSNDYALRIEIDTNTETIYACSVHVDDYGLNPLDWVRGAVIPTFGAAVDPPGSNAFATNYVEFPFEAGTLTAYLADVTRGQGTGAWLQYWGEQRHFISISGGKYRLRMRDNAGSFITDAVQDNALDFPNGEVAAGAKVVATWNASTPLSNGYYNSVSVISSGGTDTSSTSGQATSYTPDADGVSTTTRWGGTGEVGCLVGQIKLWSGSEADS